jgi:integrase
MALIDLKYLVRDVDRYGKVRWYVRVSGKKRRVLGEPGEIAFMEAYHAAVAEMLGQSTPRATKRREGTLEWLGNQYFAAGEFRRLDERSQRTRRNVLNACFDEPLRPGSTAKIGECPLREFGTKHVVVLRDRKLDKPGAANNRLKYLGSMFAWAVKNKQVSENPIYEVAALEYGSAGFHTWTADEMAAFEAKWPLGTKPRLAYALLLYTGARRGDVVTFGRQHVKNGVLTFVPSKTKRLRADPVHVPILPPLSKAIAAGPTGNLTFLVTEYGRSFTSAGFGNWFAEKCAEAGLPNCTAHGLRKAGATIVAERGASERQLMAMYGWSTPSQASVYTKAADRKRLAAQAAGLLGETTSEQSVQPVGQIVSNSDLKD